MNITSCMDGHTARGCYCHLTIGKVIRKPSVAGGEAYETEEIAEPQHCLGPQCMAWRWHHVDPKEDEDSKGACGLVPQP